MNDPNPLGPRLREQPFIIIDGGLATQLEANGHDLDDPLWSARVLLDEPEAIGRVHAQYLAAGADIVTTATYQASATGLRARGLDDDEIDRLLLRSINLAQRAIAARPTRPTRRPAMVAASLGAYGATLADGSEYRGDYAIGHEDLVRFHLDRVTRLQAVGPPQLLLAFETIPCLAEVEAIAAVLRERPMPAWVSLSCRDGRHLNHGEPVEAAAAVLAALDCVVALGINCTAPQHVESLLGRLRATTTVPLLAYPNAGERYLDGRWHGAAITPKQFADRARGWWRAGARLIGGCCRTTPRHIAALARLRDSL